MAKYGEIGQVNLGQVTSGNHLDPYGLFAATKIGTVKTAQHLAGSNSGDFQTSPQL